MSILQGCDFTENSIVELINHGQQSIISKAAKKAPPVVRGSSLDGWIDLYVNYFAINFYFASRDVLSRRTALCAGDDETVIKCGVMERGIRAWGAQTRLAKELLLRDAVVTDQDGISGGKPRTGHNRTRYNSQKTCRSLSAKNFNGVNSKRRNSLHKGSSRREIFNIGKIQKRSLKNAAKDCLVLTASINGF